MPPGTDLDLHVSPTQDKRIPFFSLIVGINDYQNFRKLAGAVADANAIDTYLQYHLGVPKDQIINLRDKTATREGIIGGFRSLQKNPAIERGDAIMIYYAGHGGEADTPPGWEAGGDKIQVILPQDVTNSPHHDQIVSPIPDRTVAGLLNDLAEEKGNNITVVFDCCHSVSGSRNDSPGAIARVVDVNNDLPSELDFEIRVKPTGREVYIPPGFLQRDLRSHVFLAACGAEELAWESSGHGVFTKALLDALTGVKVDAVTYIDLMQRIESLPKQNPQCEGFHKSRTLFNAKVPGTAPYFIEVELGADEYVLKAGSAQGIIVGSEFSVHADHIDDLKSNPVLCTLRVKDTGSFLAKLELLSDTVQCSLPAHAYARLVRTGMNPGLGLRVHFSDALLQVVGESRQAVLESCAGIGLLPTTENEAYITVALDDNDRTKMVFSIIDSLVADYGLRRLPHVVPATFDDLSRVLRAAARWKWHLERQNSVRPFNGRIHMTFTRLEIETAFDEGGVSLVARSVGEDLNAAGLVDLVVNPNHLFGLKIVNDSKRDLYPYLFYFDVNNQRIESFYDGPTGGGKADPSLRAGSSLTIGYGAGGTPPIAFSLRDVEEIDIGFLKLFLATSPIDLSSLEQSPPFFDERVLLSQTDVARSLANLEQWDTVMMTIVQRAKPGAPEKPPEKPPLPSYPVPAPARRTSTLKWLWLSFRNFFERFFVRK